MQDTIERQITVKVPKDKVYAAIADPTQVIKWFPDKIIGDYKVGEQVVLNFGEDGDARIYVEAATPTDYFAYRWVPGVGPLVEDVRAVANTLVEFHLSEEGDQTIVKLIESGFAALPAEVAQSKFEDNDGGWTYMMDRLEKLFA